MQPNQVNDHSTLLSLRPDQMREEHYRKVRTSERLHGSHFMPLRRPSRLPENARDYVPGDPVSRIDWQAYARTDHLMIREVRDESSVRVCVIVELTDTMNWPRPHLGLPAVIPCSKAEIALRVAFNVAYGHLRLGDQVQIWATTGHAPDRPDAVLVPRTLSDIMVAYGRLLGGGGVGGGFNLDAVKGEFRPERLEPRRWDLLFWVGDTLSTRDVGPLLGQGRRSFLFHVLSSLEETISWVSPDTSYFDAGSGLKDLKEYQGSVLTDGDHYAKHLALWQSRLRSRQERRGGTYMTVTDQTEIRLYHLALNRFVRER